MSLVNFLCGRTSYSGVSYIVLIELDLTVNAHWSTNSSCLSVRICICHAQNVCLQMSCHKIFIFSICSCSFRRGSCAEANFSCLLLSRGECGGRHGKFPRNFVTLLSDAEAANLPTNLAPASSALPAIHPPSTNVVAAPPVKPQQTFDADRSDESARGDTSRSSAASETRNTTRNGEGTRDREVLDASSGEDASMGLMTCSSEGGYHSLNSGVAAYGRAKFPFSAQYPNELSLRVGELVTLIRHIDDEWTEGEVNGRAGLFPTEYVDVIVDCTETAASGSVPGDMESSSGACFGRALFDFAGDTDGDLPLSAGQVVVLLRKVNADWYRARSRDGHVGICPVTFVEELVRSPEGATSAPLRKMGRFNSAPTCRADGVKRRTIPSWGSLTEEAATATASAEVGQELRSLPSAEVSVESEGAAQQLRRANTLTSSDSAAFKRLVLDGLQHLRHCNALGG